MLFSILVIYHPEVVTLSSRAFAIGLLALAALPIYAQVPVAVRTGTPTSATGASGVNSYVVSWTQGASSSYTNPTVTLTVQSTGGAATATVYLTNSLGSGTTSANQIASGTITTSSATPAAATVSWTPSTFSLAAGTTYYLVVTSMSSNFQWAFVSGGATEQTITGTTYNGDVEDLAAPAGYAPAATTFVPVSAGGSSHVLLYSVNGSGTTPGPSVIPTLGTFGLIATVTLLAFSGLLFLKRQPANPLR